MNPALRNYRFHHLQMPRTDVFFADTYDTIGPLGANRRANARLIRLRPRSATLANATGVRFAHLPFTPDHIFDKL